MQSSADGFEAPSIDTHGYQKWCYRSAQLLSLLLLQCFYLYENNCKTENQQQTIFEFHIQILQTSL